MSGGITLESLAEAFAKKDAEIERLKVLITYLADALFAYWDDPYSNGGTSGTNETLELIQRARREATK